MGVIRKTKSVKSLLEVFEHTDQAISVVELIKELQDQMNKTTVYRILERLEDENTLHSFIGKDGLKWYAKHKQTLKSSGVKSHPHFQCKTCGKTICVSVDVEIPNLAKHKIEAAELLLIGECEKCLPK